MQAVFSSSAGLLCGSVSAHVGSTKSRLAEGESMIRETALSLVLATVVLQSSESAVGLAHQIWAISQPDREADIWRNLSAEQRQAIIERAKHIYKMPNGVIVDAYNLFNWQEEASRSIVREKVMRNRGAFSPMEVASVTYKYRENEALQAFYSIGGYGAHFWLDGKLIQDRQAWKTDSFSALRSKLGVTDLSSTSFDRDMESALLAILPVVVAVDPLAQKTNSDDIYSETNSNSGRNVYINYAHICDISSDSSQMTFASAFRERAVRSRRPWYGKIANGDEVRDGFPSHSLDCYFLAPVGAAEQPALGSPQKSTNILYEVVDPKAYRMSVREVAVAFVDGLIEIPVREAKRSRGSWTCTEHLLSR